MESSQHQLQKERSKPKFQVRWEGRPNIGIKLSLKIFLVIKFIDNPSPSTLVPLTLCEFCVYSMKYFQFLQIFKKPLYTNSPIIPTYIFLYLAYETKSPTNTQNTSPLTIVSGSYLSTPSSRSSSDEVALGKTCDNGDFI